MKSILKLVISVCIIFPITSCKKFLDKKADASFSTLTTLSDMQAFLDDNDVMNRKYPGLLELLSDNCYVSSADWNSNNSIVSRNAYIWSKGDYDASASNWPYQPVLRANAVLDKISKVTEGRGSIQYNCIQGAAYFFRGLYHFAVAQLYSQPYNQGTSSLDLGIPLRLNIDIDEPSVRSTVEETYKQITDDLMIASRLLQNTPYEGYRTRPSKPAAFGLLARVFLSIGKYDSAGIYARKCLSIYDSLINFNNASEITISSSAPFKRLNKEIIFYARSAQPSIFASGRAKIDSNLYTSYSSSDLRKIAYFRANTGSNAGTYTFKGDYDGSGSSACYPFVGIVTDEMYLISAESYARSGNTNFALNELNRLLRNRITTTSFVPVTATSSEVALDIILRERRKELFFRGTRWLDMKRLRNEPSRAIVPKRILNGQVYTLELQSPRWTLEIPYQVIALTGIPQNQ